MIRKLIARLRYKFRKLADRRYVIEYDYYGDDRGYAVCMNNARFGAEWREDIRQYVYTDRNAEWYLYCYRKRTPRLRKRRVY